MKLYLLCALTLLSISVGAQETEITVLGVSIHSGVDKDLARLELTWLKNNWPSSVGTSIKLANGGNIKDMTLNGDIDFSANVLSAAKAKLLETEVGTSGKNLREYYHADVVIFFGRYFLDDACGVAAQMNWTAEGAHQFNGNPLNFDLDLNGAETSYGALVATTDVSCRDAPEITLHEFGHLHAAGHEVNLNEDPDFWLHPDSHAAEGFDWVTYTVTRTYMHNPVTWAVPSYTFSNTPGFTPFPRTVQLGGFSLILALEVVVV